MNEKERAVLEAAKEHEKAASFPVAGAAQAVAQALQYGGRCACNVCRAVREWQRPQFEVMDTGPNSTHWRWAVIHNGPNGEHGGNKAAVCYAPNNDEASFIAAALNAQAEKETP